MTLALQGGGSHGAFTWGVLDRLVGEASFEIEAISATSAGAMNAAALVCGMMEDGVPGARRKLECFWNRIGDAGRMSPLQPSTLDRLIAPGNLDYSIAFQAFDLMTRLFSPYDFNPLDLHPIRDILEDLIDFPRLRQFAGTQLFISTTNVRTGKIRVFGMPEMSADVLLASACLPLLFRAVEIEGEAFWDGGYTGNPAIYPLIHQCVSSDVILVEINPISCERVPQTSRDILNRMHDISFNSTMMREMRSIALVSRLLERHELTNRSAFRKINFHMIQAEGRLRHYGASSRFNCDPAFLAELRSHGWNAADEWLAANSEAVGKTSSINIHELFL